MKHTKCKICGKEHALGGCPEFQSTAARKDVQSVDNGSLAKAKQDSTRRPDSAQVSGSQSRPVAGTQALPVDTTIGLDKGSDDIGAKVTFRVLHDGKFEILSIDHSKAKFDEIIQKHNERLQYQSEYQRDLRMLKRLGLSCTVKEYRANLAISEEIESAATKLGISVKEFRAAKGKEE